MKPKICSLLVLICILASVAVVAAESIGNSVFADAVNGNDSTGMRGRSDLPFLTLGAAKTAATTGDTIFVRPGAYVANDLLKDGVNWHFATGASVTRATTSAAGIFDDYTGHINQPVTCIISGNGDFDGGTGAVLLVKNSTHGDAFGSNVSFTAHNVVSTGRTITIRALNVSIRANLVLGGVNAIYYNRANTDINVDQIICTGAQTIYLDVPQDEMSPDFDRFRLTAGKIQNTGSSAAIYWKAIEPADLHVTAKQIIASSLAIDSSANSYPPSSHLFVRANSIQGQVKLASGDLSVIGATVVKSDAGDGVTVSGGTATIIGGKITTQAGSNDLSQTGGTLTVVGCAYSRDKTSGTITQGDPRVASAAQFGVGASLPANGDTYQFFRVGTHLYGWDGTTWKQLDN